MGKDFFDAIRAGDVAKVQDLLREDPSLADARTTQGVPACVWALYAGQKAISDAIVAAGATLDVPTAAAVGRLDRLKPHLERDPKSVDAKLPDGYTGLGVAAYLGFADVVAYLLSLKADVNYVEPKSGFTALTGAISSGHREVVRLLVEHGADVNHRYEGGNTPLTEAAFNGDPEIVKMLLARGADVRAKTDAGRTALSFAAEKGRHEVAALLRERGARE